VSAEDREVEHRGGVRPSRFVQPVGGLVPEHGKRPEQGRIRPGCAVCGWVGGEQDAARAKQSFQRHRERHHADA
jgi:hypothetical protein